jgi:proline dehydrogenase
MQIPFNDTEVAFKAKSDRDLYQAYLLFKLVGSSRFVSLSSSALNVLIKTPLPFDPLVKATLFRQFCGGENAKECTTTINRLGALGVGTILDYSIEGAQEETVFDSTEKELLSTLTLASQSKHIPFSVFKITGLARFSLLEKIQSGSSLDSSESSEWARAQERVRRIIKRASELKVKVLIDAEESWIQDPLDELVENLMAEFNQKEAIVYHTLQMYRVDRISYLERLIEEARKKHFILGVKLVRGAYMEKERQRAADLGLPSPILPSKQATDQAYDDSLVLSMENFSHVAICAGTHNEHSTQLLVDLMEKKGISPNTQQIHFAQLLGMSDHLTFNLAAAGYQAAKYVPYGPVRSLTPYLIRRAQENTSISGQTPRELELISKELQRRRALK